MAEKWLFGSVTEDKKLAIRFLDENGDAILVSSLYGYGIEIFTRTTSILKCGVNITGYSNTYLSLDDDGYTVIISLDGSILPKKEDLIYGMTTIIIADSDMADGYFTDHGETQLLYEANLRR